MYYSCLYRSDAVPQKADITVKSAYNNAVGRFTRIPARLAEICYVTEICYVNNGPCTEKLKTVSAITAASKAAPTIK